MDPYYRPTRAEIDLDALQHNYLAYRRAIPSDIKLMAVVKADAYGHGAVEVAEAVAALGADYLGVAFMDEALFLRKAKVTLPILVLGYTAPEAMELAARHDVTVTVYEAAALAAAAEAGAASGKPVKLHVKVDTGMGRLGIADPAEAAAFIAKACGTEGVEVEGVFTHYACADEFDKSYTDRQYGRMQRVLALLAERGIRIPIVHAGNSAAGIEFPERAFDMVRLGISLYGFYPSREVDHSRVDLRPVMSLKTAVVQVKTLPAGEGVSYGATYRTSGEERIATLPIGYADGFTRMLTGRARAIVGGVIRPIVGRICMDQCMVNVTGLDVKVGDEVVLFGEQDGACIHADELADALGTINYEIVCMISHRVPRAYRRGGTIVDVVNDLRNRDTIYHENLTSD